MDPPCKVDLDLALFGHINLTGLAFIDARAFSATRSVGLARRLEILMSIPGIGFAVAAAMVVEMPELGDMDAKQAASLAGLAPIARESGRWKGKSKFGGGRRGLRNALYMPALVAIRHNLQLARTYHTLCSAGKSAKLAITAVMRKLLILANALLRDDRVWKETAP